MKIYETKTYKKFKDAKRDNFPTFLVLHHSGGTDADPLADTSHHTAEMMESYHLSKGWEGLGYHYVIHKNGDVWAGRPEHYHGAHVTNQNTVSLGVCLAGNFDATLPTKGQEDAFKELYRDIHSRYPNLKVYPHRKYQVKTCYGRKLKDDYGQNLANNALLETPPEIKDCKVEVDLAKKGLIETIISFLKSLL